MLRKVLIWPICKVTVNMHQTTPHQVTRQHLLSIYYTEFDRNRQNRLGIVKCGDRQTDMTELLGGSRFF